MDYHSLPRRQLQVLCKKHGIPANSTNSEMAEALTSLLKPKPQLHTDTSKQPEKQPEKRATRRREPALNEAVSKSKDLEDESNMKIQKATGSSCEKQEEVLNKKPQRAVRSRESASVATKSAATATISVEKTIADGETQSNSASIQQETKVVSTRNGTGKQNNREKSAESENLKAESPKSERKKEKAGGIVLRRGRVKVRSPGNLSKSPETKKNLEEGVVDSEGNSSAKGGAGMSSSQSCLVDVKKTQTRRQKRSVTFSDVLEVNASCAEHASREDSSEISSSCKDSAEGKLEEISQAGCNLEESLESACVTKKTVSTRRGSRTTNAETGGEAGNTRGKKVSTLVGEAAVTVRKEEKVLDSFVQGNQLEDGPSVLNTRRSRRLTIVPSDVKPILDKEASEPSQVKSRDHHEGSSIAPKTMGGALPAETSQRSRRRTLAPLELNDAQPDVESVTKQMEKKVSRVAKTKGTRSKAEFENGAMDEPESQQKHSDTRISESIHVVTEAEDKPIKQEEVLPNGKVRNSRRKTLMVSETKCIESAEVASNEMDQQETLTTGMQEMERNLDEPESLKARSKTRASKSRPESLQKVSKERKVEVKATTATTSAMPRSTRKATKISTHPDNGSAVSQDPAFETQSISPKQEGLNSLDEAVHQTSKDITAKACIELSSESPVLQITNEPVTQDPVNLPSNDITDNITDSERAQSLCQQIPTGNDVEQNQVSSEDASSFLGNEGPESGLCSIDGGSSSMNTTHSATCDSETGDSSSLVDTEPIKAVAAAVRCREITEDVSSDTPSECAEQEDGISSERDTSSDMKAMLVVEQDELMTDISTMKDDKEPTGGLVIHAVEVITASSPAVHMESTFEHQSTAGGLVIHAVEVITASSPAAHMESTFEHQSTVDRRVPEQELCSSEIHLDSARDEILNLTSTGAADLTLTEKQEPSQVVDFKLCDEVKAADNEEVKCQVELQLQETSEEVNCDGEISVYDRSTTNDQPGQLLPVSPSSSNEEDNVDDGITTGDQPGQLLPLLPSCNVTPGIALPRASACKIKQRRPRSIFKSARKGNSLISWESRSSEEKEDFDREDPLMSRDQTDMDADAWSLNTHDMACDEGDSSSEEGESSEETEETLSDTQVCDFNTEALTFNTEGDDSDSEDGTLSDSEEVTEFDSEEDFSEMEEELLSGEEFNENGELDNSEEELSESEEDDSEDDTATFNDCEASPVSKSVAISKISDALNTTAALEDRPVEHVADFQSSLPMNEVTQEEDLTHTDEKSGGQCKDLPEITGISDTAMIESSNDKLLSLNHTTSVDSVQSTADCICQNGSSFATPLPKVKQDVNCLSATPSLATLFATPLPKVKEDVNSLSATPLPKVNEDVNCLSATPLLATLFATPLPKAKEDVNSLSATPLPQVNGDVKCLSATPLPKVNEDVKCLSATPSLATLFAAPLPEVKEDVNSLSATPLPQVKEDVNSLSATPLPKVNEDLKCLSATPSLTTLFATPLPEVKEHINSLSATPLPKVNEDVKCLSATPSQATLFATPVPKVEEDVNSLSATPPLPKVNEDLNSLSATPLLATLFATPLSKVEEDVNCLSATPSLATLFATPLSKVAEDVNCLSATPSLATLFATPLSKVEEDVNCFPATPTETISESNFSQQSKALETDLIDFSKSGEEEGRVTSEQQSMDGNKHDTELCKLVEDQAGSSEVDSALEKEESSVHTALDSDDCIELLDLVKATTSELTEELGIAEGATSRSATPNGSEAAEGQVGGEAHSMKCDSNCPIYDLAASMAMDTTKSVLSSDSAMDAEFGTVTAVAKLHAMSQEITCNLIEEQENFAEPECEQSYTGAIGEESEFIQLEKNVESLVSEVMASKQNDIDRCSTPKCSKDSEGSNMLNSESLMDVITAMQCVDVECMSAQVEEVHEDGVYSEEPKDIQEKEAAATLNSVHEISKEKSMEQIDRTLFSLRKLRKMCKENDVSVPKKSETETPARKPFNPWTSARKQVQQPSTSTHPRELPSANKRSALKALSSNIKSTPSTAVQTPTAKVMHRPRNLMGTYDGNEGTGKHMVTPSPQAPKTSRLDLTRSHPR